MLVLSRKANQKIHVGENITITVLKIRGNTIQLGIEAPREVPIRRNELLERESASDKGFEEHLTAPETLQTEVFREECEMSLSIVV